jgi:hypothetical protein
MVLQALAIKFYEPKARMNKLPEKKNGKNMNRLLTNRTSLVLICVNI